VPAAQAAAVADSDGSFPRRRGGVRSLPAPVRTKTSPGVVAARGVFTLAGAAMLATSGVAWYGLTALADGVQSTDINKVKLVDGKPAPKHLDKSVNILLIGLDSRYAMNGDPLPDSVVHDDLHAGSCSSCLAGENANSEIILHVPANGGTPTAVSIPRDDWVEAQDGAGHTMGTMKVKEAYGNAYYNATTAAARTGTHDRHQLAKTGHDAGIKAQIATLEALLDIPIDHFAEVNLIGFYDVAGDIGPVQVCLKRAVHDQNSGADFPAGLVTLKTQANAMSFVREREDLPNGDLDRTHRQQAYITAALKKLKDDGVLSDLSKMNSLISTAEKDVFIDSGWNLLDFAANASNLAGGGTSFRTAPIVTDTEWKQIGANKEVGNRIDIPTVRAFVKNAFAGSDATAPAPSTSATSASASASPSKPASAAAQVSGDVEVFNASGVTGAAAKEVTALAPLGVTAMVGDGGPGSGISPTRTHTTVLYGTGAAAAAKAVADQLGGVTATASTSVKTGTVVVYIGTDKGATINGTSTQATSTRASTSGQTSAPSTPSTSATAGNSQNGGTISSSGPDSVNGIPCVN
jgi:LCP family protein required for cell wall assembly